MPMSDLRFHVEDVRELATIDAEITSTLSQMRELVEKTLAGLAGIDQNLRGSQVMSQEVTGPILLLERSYLDRFNHLEDARQKLLNRRFALLNRQIELAGDSEIWLRQRDLTERILAESMIQPHKFPDMGQNRRIPVERARKLLANATVDYQLNERFVGEIWQLWQSAEKPDWPSLIEQRQAIAPDWYQGGAIGEDKKEEKPSSVQTETASPTPPIRQREEVAEKPIQHQSAEPPLPAQEEAVPESTPADWLDVDLDEVDDEISIEPPAEQPAQPSPLPVPQPASPIIPLPSEPDLTAPAYRPPKPMPSPQARGGARAVERSLPEAIIEPTHFTAYAPKEVPPAIWTPLAAYIFRESASGAVDGDAKQKFGAALADMRHGKAAALAAIEEGATITATPRLDGFTFNPESLSLKFVKPYHRFDFEMMAGRERLNLASNGAVTFAMGGVLVGEIPLSVFVGERATIEVGVVEADPYQKIFCSYSHRDTRVVERVERAYRVLGFDYLRDVTRLRSGQQWNAELMRWIDEAHIFQLFWSAAAAQSPYVEQEWRHALQQTRPNFIRPVYWKKPLVAPPAELGKLHFAYDPQIQGVGWWNRLVGLVRG